MTKYNHGSTTNQFLATFTINIPMLYYGCNIGWISPTILKLRSPQSPTGEPMSEEALSWLLGSLCLGATVATPFYGYLADAFGRKPAILAASVPSAVSWLIMWCYPTTWSLILGRTLAGISAGGALILVPMYVAEISEPKCRGLLGILLTFLNVLGVLLGYLAGGLLKYHLSVAVFMGLPVLHICVFAWLPETPVYLTKKGKMKEAAQSLAWFRNLSTDDKIVVCEMDQLQLQNTNSRDAPKITLKEIARNRSSRHGLIIIFIILTFQCLSGGYVVMNFVGVIFDAAFKGNNTEDVGFFTSIILSNTGSSVFVGFVMFLGSIVGILLIDKCGRKPLLIGSFACMTLCLTTLGIWFYINEHYPKVDIPGWLPITATSLFVLACMSGISSVPWVIISEVFSFEVRSALSVVVLMWMWMLSFIVLQTFSPLVSLVGIHNVIWFFSFCNFLGIFYTIFCVPETRGRTLKEIAAILEHKKTKTINAV